MVIYRASCNAGFRYASALAYITYQNFVLSSRFRTPCYGCDGHAILSSPLVQCHLFTRANDCHCGRQLHSAGVYIERVPRVTWKRLLTIWVKFECVRAIKISDHPNYVARDARSKHTFCDKGYPVYCVLRCREFSG